MRIFQSLCLFLFVATHAQNVATAQEDDQGYQSGVDNICTREAPWNRTDGLDARAADVLPAAEWAAPVTASGHPASGLAGIWTFELHGNDVRTGMATAGQFLFRQDGEGYECDNRVGCGYKPALDDAGWLFSGERWGHSGRDPNLPETPVEITRDKFTVEDNGSFEVPQARYNPFPGITGQFDPNSPDTITGVWTLDWGGEIESGRAVFKRIKPKITAIKYNSDITHVADPEETGCIALQYRSESWGRGNNSRGNRPGFSIDIIGDDFPAFSRKFVKIWMDPRTNLEIHPNSPQPILDTDANGAWTGKILGYRVFFKIWPWSKWGPKVLHIEGQPITFDYYVQPKYPAQLDAPRMKLVEGVFPELPVPGESANIGFRLVNMPTYEARAVKMHISFFDAKTMVPVPGLEVISNVCKLADGNAATCAIDTLAVAKHEEFEFQIPMSDNGMRWIANWKYEGGDPAGYSQQGTIKADPSPQIVHAFSLINQSDTFRAQTTDYLYPYAASGWIAGQKRTVVLVGKSLPQKFADPVQIESFDPAVSYQARLDPDLDALYVEAWLELSRRFKIPVETLKDTQQILLLDATISGQVLPGSKTLTLNGKPANWDLRFGGLQARVEFVREVVDPQSGATNIEVLETAYSPERIRVRVTTSQSMPVDHLPLLLKLQRRNQTPIQVRIGRGEPAAHTLNTVRLTATNSFGLPTVYLSDPIRLVDKGRAHLSPPPSPRDIPIEIFLNGEGPDQLKIEVDSAFIAESFLLDMTKATHNLPISSTPEEFRHAHDPNQTSDFLFKSTLRRAAACKDVTIHDWGALSIQESDRLTNWVVITYQHHTRSTLVRMAHHAAMLMMRDLFVEKLNTQLAVYNQILPNDLALKAYLKAIRLSLDDSSIAINRIKVTAPDGSQTEFGGWPIYENVEHLASRFNSTPEDMARWRLRATAEAIANISTEISAAAERARSVGQCDLEELIKLTGTGFENVNAVLAPRLMRVKEARDADGTRRLFWEPDLAARHWITDISRIAKRLATQRQTASDDNKRLSTLFKIAATPLTAGASGSLFYLLTTTNLAITAVETAADWSHVLDSKIELDFSRDAAVVLGFARNDQAIKKAVSWHTAYNKTLLAVGASVFDLVSIKQEIAVALFRQKEVVLKGQLATSRIPPGGLRAMTPIERKQIELLAIRAKARELSSEADVLTSIEKRAINAVEDDFRAARTELIRSGEASAPLGGGGELVLPSAFNAKTAIVRFEPADLAAIRQGRPVTIPEDGAIVRIARAENGTPTVPPPLPDPGASTVLPPPGTVILPSPDLPRDLMRKLIAAGDDVFARGRALADEVLLVPPAAGSPPVTIPLGEIRGSGSFSSVTDTLLPYAEFPTLAKVNFGGHDAAEIYGEAALNSIPSPRFLMPRKIMHIDVNIKATGPAGLFHSVSVVEDMGVPARVLFESGAVTDLHRSAIRAALDDINGAGLVFLDFKWNNFSIVERNGRTMVAFFDFGGIVRVKGSNAALAREIQNVVVGPWENVHRQLANFGIHWPKNSSNIMFVPAQGRKALILEKYGDQIADFEQLEVKSLDKLGFWPSAGDELDAETVQLFTAARRGPPE